MHKGVAVLLLLQDFITAYEGSCTDEVLVHVYSCT